MRQKQEKEWKEAFGQQAVVKEIQDEAEKERKIEQDKAKEEMKKKQEKEWEEYFGDSVKIFKGREEEIIKPSSVPETKPFTGTEVDSEYVLGKERAKLAKELGERMRAKSAGEETKAAEKASPQKQEKQEKVPFSLKGFLRELDMQQSLKLVEAIEKFAKREKSKEKLKKEPTVKREKTPFSLKRFLEELDMQQTLKLVTTLEKAVKKEKIEKPEGPKKERLPFSFKKFLEKRRWKQTTKAVEKLEGKHEKSPPSLRGVLGELGMDQTLKLLKLLEEFAKKSRGRESFSSGKFLEKMKESKTWEMLKKLKKRKEEVL